MKKQFLFLVIALVLISVNVFSLPETFENTSNWFNAPVTSFDANVKEGDYSAQFNSNVNWYCSNQSLKLADGNIFETWVRTDDVSASPGVIFALLENNCTGNYEAAMVLGSNKFVCKNGLTETDFTTVPSVNTWYKLKMNVGRQVSAGRVDCNIYDASGALLETQTVTGTEQTTPTSVGLYAQNTNAKFDNSSYNGIDFNYNDYDNTPPVINTFSQGDFNVNTGDFNILMQCTDSNSKGLLTRLTLDDQNVWSSWDANNTLLNKKITLHSGTNRLKYYCTDSGLNTVTTPEIPINLLGVTVKIPKDERTAINLTPYSLRLNGGITQLVQNINQDFNLFLINGVGVINIDVNVVNYFSRKYAVDTDVLTSNFVIQPYLVNFTDGYKATIFVLKAGSQVGIPNILVRLYKVVSGTDYNIMEQQYTDAIGNVAISMYSNDTYKLVLSNGIQVLNSVLNADQTTYNFYIGEEVTPPPTFPYSSIDLNWHPNISWLYQNDLNKLDLNQNIRIYRGTISRIDVNVTWLDKNIFSDRNITITQAGTLFEDVNALKIYKDYNGGIGLLKINIKITTTDGNIFLYSKSYSISKPGEFNLTQFLTFDLPALFGETNSSKTKPTLAIIAIFVTIMVVGFVGARIQFDAIGTGMIGMASMGFFMFLGWLHWVIPASVELIFPQTVGKKA